MDLTHFSTFTGIAGFDLAAEEAGFRTIGQVEKNPYRQRLLKKYWPDVPLWEDIRYVTEESLKEAGILANARSGTIKAGCKQTRRSERTNLDRGCARATLGETTILVTGGFPCQSFSVAGKRKGKADDRYLWPEMFRVIKLLRPHWVLAENVTGIIKMALDDVLSDLESEGYSTQAFNIPACGVNAPHRRERIWIVAYYEGSGLRSQFNKLSDKLLSENGSSQELESSCGYVADSKCEPRRHSKCGGREILRGEQTRWNLSGRWDAEPDVGRVAHGIPSRVDRLSALGDAIVHQVAYEIIKSIAVIEKSIQHSR